jgi:hypothetical protein
VRKFVLYIFAHAVPEIVPFLLFALSDRPGLSPIGDVLALDDDILELDPALWAGPDLPGHHPHRAQLRRHRARREPHAAN